MTKTRSQASSLPLSSSHHGSQTLLRKREVLVASLFGLTVVLNLTDLITTSLALSVGLTEGNLFLTGLASLTSLNLLDSLIILKVVFISTCGFAALLGIGAQDPRTRQVATVALAVYTLLLLVVLVNNVYWLLVI